MKLESGSKAPKCNSRFVTYSSFKLTSQLTILPQQDEFDDSDESLSESSFDDDSDEEFNEHESSSVKNEQTTF